MYVCKSVRSTYSHMHMHIHTDTHAHTYIQHLCTHTTYHHTYQLTQHSNTMKVQSFYTFTIVGENAGRPLLSVAETRAGPLGEGKKTKGASNILSHAREVI